jgi:dolichyl-phosphate-mannose--protein O-mannosyl transferase
LAKYSYVVIALLDSWVFAPRVRAFLERFGIYLVLALAALLRFVNLASPHRLVFDETWYVKDAMTLNRYGYEGSWPNDPNATIEAGNPDISNSKASFVVHPPLGKWIIGLGLRLFGNNSSFGWRFSAALFGVLLVALVYLIA